MTLTTQAPRPWGLPRSVLFLTALALVLRAVGSNRQLWYDEIRTVVQSIRLPLETVLTTFSTENQHTLYSLLSKGAVAVLGEEPFALRLWALLLGVISVPVLYRVGRVVTSHREALGAATLLTVSYHHIWFSQNARGYTGLLLATLLTTGFFLVGLQRPGWRLWLAYGVTAALGAYMHLTMVFVVVSHALVLAVLALDRRRRPASGVLIRAVGGIALAGVLTIALYAPALPEMTSFFLRERTLSIYARPDAALAYAFRGLRLGYGLIGLVGGAILGALGALRYLRQSYPVLLLLVLPGVLGFAVMVALGNDIYPRFFFYAAGLALLIVARGVAAVADGLSRLAAPDARLRASNWIYAGSMGVVVIVSILSFRTLYGTPKQDFVGALRYVESTRTPDEPVAIVGNAWIVYLEYYRAPWMAVKDRGQLERIVASPGRTWLVYTFRDAPRFSHPDLIEYVDARFQSVRTFPGTQADGEVRVLVERGAAGEPLEGR